MGSSSGSSDFTCWPTGIKTLPNGNSYIKGWHGDNAAFSDTILTNEYGLDYDYFIGKFDSNGEAMWVRSIDEMYYGLDYNQFDIDAEGNVYLGAQLRDTAYFQYNEEEYEYIPAGENDLFIAQYTTEGDIGWIKTMESRYGYNWLSSITVTENSVYATGYFDDYISMGTDEYYSESAHGFIVQIKDNQPPTDISLSNDTIGLNEPAGTHVGTFSTSDPDSDDEHSYSLISGDGENDADNDKFSIIDDTLATATDFDYDSPQELNIYVQTEDNAGNTYEKDFVIYLTEEDDEETAIHGVEQQKFNIYPNPVKNYLYIVNKDKTDDNQLNLNIFTMEGACIYKQTLQNSKLNKINIEQIPKGAYLLEIIEANHKYQYKFIKQ